MSVKSPSSFKSTLALYRDSLKLVKYVAGESPKAVQMKQMIASEFRRNKDVSDPEKVEELRFNAVRALSNYLIFENSAKDPKLQKRIDEWKEKFDRKNP